MKLEIGPGPQKLGDDWTTVSAAPGAAVDHLAEWGLDTLPFPDKSFTTVYACHVIEHVGWMNAERAIMEAWRVLIPGGELIVHTIDFAQIVDAYRNGQMLDQRFKPGELMLELSYRLFAYPKRNGDRACFNWHHSMYDREWLTSLFTKCGFGEIEDVADPLGEEKHGAYNLGLRGIKL